MEYLTTMMFESSLSPLVRVVFRAGDEVNLARMVSNLFVAG